MTAFSHKPFAIYFISNSLSLLGLWMQKVSIGWLAWNLTESTFWTSFVALSLMAPAGILGPFFGVWAEKWDMRKATIILKVLMFFISIMIFYLQFIQAHSIFSIAVLTLIYGILSAIYHPVRLVFVSIVVKKSFLGSAIGLNSASFNASRVIGPAIAGFLMLHFDLQLTFLVSALLYLPIILILFFIPLEKRDTFSFRKETFKKDFFEGLRYSLKNKIIKINLYIVFINALFVRGVLEIQPTIAGEILSGSSTSLSLITASAGIGALLASIFLGSSKYLQNNLSKIFLPMIIFGFLSSLFIGIFNDIEIIILLFLFLGFSTTLIGIGTQTLIQLEVSEQFRARVLTWWSTISFGSLSIGGILIGLFGEIIPLELVLIITPIVGYLSYIYFLRRFNGSFSLSSKNVNA